MTDRCRTARGVGSDPSVCAWWPLGRATHGSALQRHTGRPREVELLPTVLNRLGHLTGPGRGREKG